MESLSQKNRHWLQEVTPAETASKSEERVGAPELLSVLKCLTGQFTDQRENMFAFKGKMLGYKERQYRKWKGKEGKRNKIQKGN